MASLESSETRVCRSRRDQAENMTGSYEELFV